MTLASMIDLGEEELICDLAEVYCIYDYMAYVPSYIAILATGLGDNSRIKKKLMGLPTDLSTFILAIISDNIANYIWAMGGRKGDAPGNFVSRLMGEEEQKEQKYRSFASEDALLDYLNKSKE